MNDRDRLVEGSSVTEILRDFTEIISTKADLSQPRASPVRHHPVDPRELLSGQFKFSVIGQSDQISGESEYNLGEVLHSYRVVSMLMS